MGQITITQDLIPLLGQSMYSNPHPVILVRELLQNAVDACQSTGRLPEVRVNLASEPRYTTVTIEDNGIGMDKSTLESVFLKIGASLKPGGAIGGFGIAKVALFSCQSWRLWTNDLYVDSTDLDVKPSGTPRIGTKIVALIDRVNSGEQSLIDQYVLKSNRPGIRYNRVKVEPYEVNDVKHPGYNYVIGIRRTREQSRIYYRIGGLVQFTEVLYDTKGYHILVDFGGIGYRPRDISYPFTLSREELRDPIAGEVYSQVQAINTDKLSNLDSKPRERGKGKKQSADRPEYRHAFVAGIHYRYYHRGAHFSLDDKRLVKIWQCVLRIVNPTAVFKVGLADDSTAAAFLARESGELVFYVNPEHAHCRCTSTDTTIAVLWHLACHESAHIVQSWHDERFTCQEAALANTSAAAVFCDARLKDLIRYYREQLASVINVGKRSV